MIKSLTYFIFCLVAMGVIFWAYFWSITVDTPSRTALPDRHGKGGNLYGKKYFAYKLLVTRFKSCLLLRHQYIKRTGNIVDKK